MIRLARQISHEQVIASERFFTNGFITKKELQNAIDECIRKVESNIAKIGELYPTPATSNNAYAPIQNIEWTNGFWTGILWLCYEETGEDKFRLLAEKHVESFLHRIENMIEVEHHDLGFLYSLSCVSAYKLTGNERAKKAALLAADKLMSRYQPVGEFIQAWGELGARDNYRLIVDCLMNIPLLFWAYEVTGEEHYREVALKHYETTIQHAIRDDASAFHTYYFDPETGKGVEGKTRQGYSDSSSWSRGQAWLVYGIALSHSYYEQDSNIELFEAITNYFLNRLPEDFVCYWDFIFDDSSNQSKDSSAAAIAVCGMNLMQRYLPEINQYKLLYQYAQHAMLRSLMQNYTEQKTEGITALLNEGVYSWHSGKGVNEGNIWGDYYYLEALIRFKKNWRMYW